MKKYEVGYVYVDYVEDEEPEMFYATVEADSREEAMDDVRNKFSQIEILEVKEV